MNLLIQRQLFEGKIVAIFLPLLLPGLAGIVCGYKLRLMILLKQWLFFVHITPLSSVGQYRGNMAM